MKKQLEKVPKSKKELGTFSSQMPAQVPKSVNNQKNNDLHIVLDWIPVDEVGNLLGVSSRTIKKACKAGKYEVKQVPAKRGRAGWKYLISVSSLPPEAQVKYWWQQRALTGAPTPEPAEVPNLPEAEKKLALARYDLVRLYMQATGNAGHGATVAAKRDFLEKYHAGMMPELLVTVGPVSFQTIERWRKTIEEHNDPFLLARKYNRQKKGRKLTQREAEVILAKVLSPNRPKINEAIRMARQELGTLNLSDMTIRRWLDDWKKDHYDLWTFYRHGEKALNDRVLPYIERDRDAIEVGDVVVVDGHTLNFEVLNPWTGKPKRMTLIMVYDMKSNFPLGWEIMPTENTQAIAAAFRRAILRLGFLPRVFYLDNGKAFRSKFFSGVEDFRDSGVSGLFERLGCAVLFAWPYHGQSKTVERFFGSFAELERQLPSYSGTSIANKPARMQRNEKWHKKMHEIITAGTTMTIEQAHVNIAYWCSEYVQRPQQDGYLKGRTPLDVYSESLERVKALPDFQNRIITPSRLDYLMMNTAVKTLYRKGIRLLGGYYYSSELYPYQKGAGSRELVIRYDIEQIDAIQVYAPDGTFICTATRSEKVHPAAAALGREEDVKRLRKAIDEKRTAAKQTRKLAGAFLEHVHGNSRPQPQPAKGKTQEEDHKTTRKKRALKLFKFELEDEARKAVNE